MTVANKEFDDFIILKGNGDPIFHLAVVVDDGLMKVTHIIRGDDHLTNAARHVMLFNALGYDLPVMAHLPMVLDEDWERSTASACTARTCSTGATTATCRRR